MTEPVSDPSASKSRRTFLTRCGCALAGLLVHGAGQAAPLARRALAFMNVHTGESLDVTYWSEGSYVASALANINHLLRDYRTGEVLAIDLGLLDLLHAIRSELSTKEAFELVSGYRSPQTNARLRQEGHNVAKSSLHTAGKAADIRIPGVRLEQIRDVGLALRRGGVGYYQNDGFVHIDVGRVRYW